MNYSFQSTSMFKNVLPDLRKGGLQIFSWFTINIFNIKFKEETHPNASLKLRTTLINALLALTANSNY